MNAVQVIVRGRVQGVFFRVYTRDEAQRLGLAGWVRNRSDGSVECFAQGSKSSVEALIRFLHKGSPASRVDTVEVREVIPDSSLQGFRITY